MNRYCGKCGAKLDGVERVCGRCGMPVEGDNLDYVINRRKSGGKIKIVISLFVIVIIAIIIIGIISNFVGKKGFVRKIMNAYKDYDIETLIENASDVYYYRSVEEMESYFESTVGNTLDYFEENAGHNYKFTYKISEIYDISERRKNEIYDDIENSYPEVSISIIDKLVVADVQMTAEKDGKSIISEVSLTLSKESDKWRILYIE